MRQPKQQQQQSPATESTAKPPLPPPPHHRTPPPLPSPWPHTRHHSDESPRSPLRSDSPHFSDLSDKPNSSPPSKTAAEKYYSPLQSPLPNDDGETTPDGSVHLHTINLSRAGRQEALPSALVVDGGGRGVFGGNRRRSKGAVEEIVNRSSSSKEAKVVKAALVVRICEVVLSLISFSVMATDRTEGWSGDSFDRYKEYRFCLSINVIAFAYAAFQACDLTYNLATGKHAFSCHFRYQFDFLMDQALAYLLMSASSASASRIDDWQTNWGKDAFTAKASVSVSLSFLAFFGFALSSVISGYNLCNRDFI